MISILDIASNIFIVIGKKQNEIINKIFGNTPYPNHKTYKGATTIVGRSCEIIIKGYKERFIKLKLSISRQRKIASIIESINPVTAIVKEWIISGIMSPKILYVFVKIVEGAGVKTLFTTPVLTESSQKAAIIKISTNEGR